MTRQITIETLIAVGSFAMGFGSSLLAAMRWYKESQRREYAAERDFQHLQKDYKNLSNSFVELDEKIDRLESMVLETRGAITVLLKRSAPTN
jgi:peptidoglycan hydrolase CwlO-like protein